MGEKAEYRSAKRSRRMIQQAYLELVKEKEIEKITVTDIVTRADLNRGTFYAHYQNAQAVLAEIENMIIGKMVQLLSEFYYKNFFKDPLPLLLKASNYFEENAELFRIFLGRKGSEQFGAKLKDIFVKQLKSNSEIPDSIKNTPQFIIRAHFFAGGIINTYQAWFRGDLDKSMEEISLGIGDIIAKTFSALADNV